MNPELLSLVQCPRCHGPLAAGLCCAACSQVVPVVNGIPRLAGEASVASFGRQWNRYDVARADEDEAVFRIKTGADPNTLAGKLVLDVECCRWTLFRARRRAHGGRVVGVDPEP